MKPNILYAVLTQLLTQSPEFKLFANISPVHAENTEARPYYRLELPCKNIAVNDLTLYEAHVSIYKKVLPHKASMGPSHFTAVFHNADGQVFRMHLYLDDSDQLACPPSWEKPLDDGRGYIKVEPPEEMDYLAHSIWESGLSCLQELRQQQGKMVVELSKQYQAQEKVMNELSKDLSKNRTEYLKSLNNSLETAQLLALVSENPLWPCLASYFGKEVKKTAQTLDSDETRLKTNEKQLSAVNRPKNKKNPCSAPINSSAQTFFAESKLKPVGKLQKQVNAISAKFESIKKASPQAKGPLLIALNDDILNLIFRDSLSVGQVGELREMEAGLARHAKVLLQSALLGENYDFAKTLYPFYYQLKADALSLALKQKHTGFLEFLASEVRLAINSYPVTVNGKEFPNAAHFFYHCSTSDLLDCFNVFIKHGLNLMQPVGPDKLPLAHLIISNKHCLFAAFKSGESLTLNNQFFYGQLICELKRCLHFRDFQEDKKIELEAWISKYEQDKILAKNQTRLLGEERQLAIQKLCMTLDSKVPATIIAELAKDRDIITKENVLVAKTNILMKKNVIVDQQHVDKFIAELQKRFENGVEMNADFKQLKARKLQWLDMVIELVELNLQLFDIVDAGNTILTQKQALNSKEKSRYKRLENRDKELRTKIGELQHEIGNFEEEFQRKLEYQKARELLRKEKTAKYNALSPIARKAYLEQVNAISDPGKRRKYLEMVGLSADASSDTDPSCRP